jgi:hypothetical protein
VKNGDFFTVVYQINDVNEWGKNNPLKYEHNGLKAIIVRKGNAVDELHKLEDEMEVVQ